MMTYFDSRKETKIVVDASLGRLGGSLTQEDIPKLGEKCYL
jgi:hypothetical protein